MVMRGGYGIYKNGRRDRLVRPPGVSSAKIRPMLGIFLLSFLAVILVGVVTVLVKCRWRPRFSLRTFAIIVTLVCGYFACWGPTQRAAEQSANFTFHFVPDMGTIHISGHPHARRIVIATAPVPLIIRADEVDINPRFACPRRYYLWLFGTQFKLPFESVWQIPNLQAPAQNTPAS